MRRLIAVAALLILALAGCRASRPLSSQLEKVEFRSEALEKSMRVNVYLPAGYTPDHRYPVLYMLHGYSGDEEAWAKLGLLKQADELIARGKIQPLIIVLPQIDNSFGINSGGRAMAVMPSDLKNSPFMGRYEDYLYQDLIRFVEGKYPAMATREGRWIGGLSMGGFAAIHLAFRHPDLFSRTGGHSPAIWTDNFEDQYMENWLYPPDLRAERDPIAIARSQDLSSLEVYLDCGSSDSLGLYKGTAELAEMLRARGVRSQYHLNAGDHNAAYWQAHLEEYLLFYTGRQEGTGSRASG